MKIFFLVFVAVAPFAIVSCKRDTYIKVTIIGRSRNLTEREIAIQGKLPPNACYLEALRSDSDTAGIINIVDPHCDYSVGQHAKVVLSGEYPMMIK